MDEENLRPNYINSVNQALYRERRNKCAKLSKYREQVNIALDDIRPINTSKAEYVLHVKDMCLELSFLEHSLISSFLCENIKKIYDDGTLKCCPKYGLK